MANTKRIRPAAGKAPGSTVHRLKITLRGSQPPIWRRLEVPSDSTLEQLHHIIQTAFGWEDCHMWVFQTPAGDYGLADRELGHRDAASQRLGKAASRPGTCLQVAGDNCLLIRAALKPSAGLRGG